jgi:6-phosphogluconolactonase/glucosamine-6-phosphate isomerase/deaminase
MTVSFAFLERSAHVFLLLEGEKKKAIFEKIIDLTTDYHDYPARKILYMNQAEIYFLQEIKK